jgi:hypothetical protein
MTDLYLLASHQAPPVLHASSLSKTNMLPFLHACLPPQCDVWMHAACCGVRRAPPGKWMCGACSRAAAAARVAQACGATLVVCPTSILHQWWVAEPQTVAVAACYPRTCLLSCLWGEFTNPSLPYDGLSRQLAVGIIVTTQCTESARFWSVQAG